MSADAELEPAAVAPPKEDPESLALRARPPRAIRFRRGVIVGLAAVSSISVMATAWIALRPPSFRLIASADERSAPSATPGDALAGLPATYGDAPKLGPPLPGDLGKPILDRQREQVAAMASTGRTMTATVPSDPVRDTRLADAEAALRSGLLIKPAGSSTAAEGRPSGLAPPPLPSGDIAAGPALDPDRDPNAQGRKLAFLAANDRGGAVNPHPLVAAPSPNALLAGSIIAASLITGLRSDVPGLVMAQVTERVFDSVSGRTLLIPQGARLMGNYDSVVAFGQRRALVVWQRIVFPDGSSIALDNVPATDPAGYAGLADKVDFHTWSLLKGAALSTLLGVGTNLSFSGDSDLVQAIRQSSQQNAARAGDRLVSRGLQVQPTITIRPGATVRMVVHRDLVLPQWQEAF